VKRRLPVAFGWQAGLGASFAGNRGSIKDKRRRGLPNIRQDAIANPISVVRAELGFPCGYGVRKPYQ
jgi:hypothetical protein